MRFFSRKPFVEKLPVTEEHITAEQYLRLTPSDRRNIKHVETIPPKFGEKGFGAMLVHYRIPVLRNQQSAANAKQERRHQKHLMRWFFVLGGFSVLILSGLTLMFALSGKEIFVENLLKILIPVLTTGGGAYFFGKSRRST